MRSNSVPSSRAARARARSPPGKRPAAGGVRFSARSPALREVDRAVTGERPVRVVRDLPNVSVGIGEGARVPAPLGPSGGAGDRRSRTDRRGEHGVDFLGRADVVRQLDARSALAAERRPQSEHHPAGLEEDHLFVGLLGAGPSERLVEGASAGEILYAKGYEADPLFHGRSMSLGSVTSAGSQPRSWAPAAAGSIARCSIPSGLG